MKLRDNACGRGVYPRAGNDESVYLAPLHEIANSGKNWAVRLLEKFEGEWKGDIDKVYDEMDYAKSPSVLKPEPVAVAHHSRPPAFTYKKAI